MHNTKSIVQLNFIEFERIVVSNNTIAQHLGCSLVHAQQTNVKCDEQNWLQLRFDSVDERGRRNRRREGRRVLRLYTCMWDMSSYKHVDIY